MMTKGLESRHGGAERGCWMHIPRKLVPTSNKRSSSSAPIWGGGGDLWKRGRNEGEKGRLHINVAWI